MLVPLLMFRCRPLPGFMLPFKVLVFPRFPLRFVTGYKLSQLRLAGLRRVDVGTGHVALAFTISPDSFTRQPEGRTVNEEPSVSSVPSVVSSGGSASLE